MQSYTIELIVILTVLFSVFSCTNPKSQNSSDNYTVQLQSKFPQISVTTDTLSFDSSVLEPGSLRKLPQSNRFIMVDAADQTIVLITKEGKVLSVAGGEGKGPGEFQRIVQLHVGADGRIYCLDMLLFRITVFEVRDKQLQYVESISYENPQNHSLHNVFITDFGWFGVYNKSKGFQTSENSHVLYRLDKNGTPTEKLLQLPGNQREKVTSGDIRLFVPNVFLNRTFWEVDGEWFYYLQTKDPVVRKYNLRTGKQKKLPLHQLPERPKTSSYLQDIKERFMSLARDELWPVTK